MNSRNCCSLYTADAEAACTQHLGAKNLGWAADPVSHLIYNAGNSYSARVQYTYLSSPLSPYALRLLGFYLSLVTKASAPNA